MCTTRINKPLATIDIEEVLADQLVPALPESVTGLLKLSQNPDNGPAELAVPIESDLGLASQVLRFVNSSYFGFSHEISTIKLALTLVGVQTIRNFVVWTAIIKLLPDPKCGPFDLKRAWQDLLRRALFARNVAKILGVADPEEPFSAALLQDVAVPLLARAVPDVYTKLLEERCRTGARLSEIERRVLGWTHADAGGIVCRLWKLPERLAVPVENHTAIQCCTTAAEDDPGSAVVALSALLPSTLDKTWTERDLFERCYEEILPPSDPGLLDLAREVDRQFSGLAPMLKLPLGDRALADLCASQTE